ncbi:hypothetical protein ACW73L_08800 [Methylolobus aquaticus]
MNSNHRIVLGAAFAIVTLTHLTSASAMGRSTVQTAGDRAVPVEFSAASADAAVQFQVEALRKELAELRAQLATIQQLASND